MAPMPQEESLFSHLEFVGLDEIFAVVDKYKADPAPEKVSLGIGVYRDDDGKGWRLPAVTKAESLLLEDPTFDHEYLPNRGYGPFCDLSRDLIFGPSSSSPVPQDCIASAQTLSGTGANHLGARFLTDFLPCNPPKEDTRVIQRRRKVWMSDPTWPNHHLIWNLVAGGSSGKPFEQVLYPYYHAATRSLDFEGLIRKLDTEAERGDVILLHACAHNPTGVDPTRDQWRAIADLCQRKGIFPFFDAAYQGFASGDLDNDAWAIREFAARGMEMCVAQSFSKNLGLYGQRVGAFHLVCKDAESARKVGGQIVELQRGEFSTPPAYGARVASTLLSSPTLTSEWRSHLITMSSRIKSMRHALYDELIRLNTPGSWEHVINQIGMFSYTGLTEEQVKVLAEEWHVYMVRSGRISISGLSTKNVKYVAKAIDSVVRRSAKIANGNGNGHVHHVPAN